MRTIVTLDDEPLKTAVSDTGIMERSALVNAGLKALVERGAARRLAKPGGSDPDAWAPPRRRPAEAE